MSSGAANNRPPSAPHKGRRPQSPRVPVEGGVPVADETAVQGLGVTGLGVLDSCAGQGSTLPGIAVPAQDADSLRIALNAMPVGVSWATLADQKIIFMNRKFTELFGYVLGDFPEISDWIEHYPDAEERRVASARWSAFFSTPSGSEFLIEPMELRIRCKDGAVKTVMHHGVILPEAGWALATFVDISDRKRDEVRLQETERVAREEHAMLQLVVDHSPEMIILSPFDLSRRYVSPAVLQVTGFTAEEYLSRRGIDMIHPEQQGDALAVVEALRRGTPSQTFRYRALQKDGGYKWVQASVSVYRDPGTNQAAGYVATVRDIAEQVEHEYSLAFENRRLSEVAALDELTGIANRRSFNQAFDREASRQGRSEGELSVLLIDVDHFKRYNDRYGHLAGDACLWSIAQAIQNGATRTADVVARYGGEEFVVLAPMTSVEGAKSLAGRILEEVRSLGLPHADSPHGIVTVSIGLSTWIGGQTVDREGLMLSADRALYGAKDAGRNVCRFLPCEVQAPAQERWFVAP